jgi:hypothetical protein
MDYSMDTKIFISHKHSDENIASALVDLLTSALEVSDSQIRCTSVPGHQLPFGRTIAQQLKEDISASSGVIIIATQGSLTSKWVLFELGASWALGKILIPILGPGLNPGDLPGPVSEYPCVKIDGLDASIRLRDALSQMASVLGMSEKSGGKAEAKLNEFINAFRVSPPIEVSPPRIEQAMAFEISWLIMTILSGSARHPRAIFHQVHGYLAKLDISLQQPIEQYVRTDDVGASVMELLETIGGQLVVQHPDLVPYFEAGINLLLDAARNEGRGFSDILGRMQLPAYLTEPREDKLQWANQIHEYLEDCLHRPNAI